MERFRINKVLKWGIVLPICLITFLPLHGRPYLRDLSILVTLSSNVGALATSLLNGKVFLALGLIGAVASIAGHWLGSGLAIKDGSKIVKPAILVVLALLAIKVIADLL